jgi:predicted PurR-regulated permease PerM
MNGNHRHRADGIRTFRENHRKRSGSNGRNDVDSHAERVVGQQLHFFPTSFALPRALFGIVTIIAVVLLIAALFFQVSGVITPFLLALLATILIYPFRGEPKLRPLILVGAIVFLVWFITQSVMVLIPFVLAFLLAYIVEPVVTMLQRKFFIKRWIPSLAATLILVGLLVVVVVYMIPIFVAQLGNAISSIDVLVEQGVNWARSGGLADLTGLSQDKINSMIDRYLLPQANGIDDAMINGARDAAVALPAILSTAFHFLAIPFLMFYFIKDYWRIRAAVYSFIPQEYQIRSQRLLRDLDEIVGGFLRGDVITSIFQGTFIGVGLHIIGVPGALLLGVVTGFLCLIPFVGGIIAYVLALFGALYMPNPALSLLYVTILFFVQAVIESTVVSPHVLGRHTDLHPLLVILSVLIFGFFWGVFGMLVGIPVTALLLRFAMRWRTRRHAELEEEKVRVDIARNPHHARAGMGVMQP